MASQEIPRPGPEYLAALAVERPPRFKERLVTEILDNADIELQHREQVVALLTEYAEKHQLEEFFDDFEVRDKNTLFHEMRVTAIGLDLALQEAETNKEIEQYFETIGVGLFLHDGGKLDVPQEILRKAGALTPEELAIVNDHPKFGLTRLLTDRRLVSAASVPGIKEIIAFHHAFKKSREAENGSVHAYPIDLAQTEDRPDAYRDIDIKNMSAGMKRVIEICAAADSYDALTDRTRDYRKPASSSEDIVKKISLDQNLPEDLIKKVASRFPKSAPYAAAAAAA